MGASNSKLEEDKSLLLCRDRKKYIKKALDGRCLLADTHIAYIQSMSSTGRALREFCELEDLVEPSLSTSTIFPPESHVPDQKHSSGLSFSMVSGTSAESVSPASFQASHMKFAHFLSKKREGNVASPMTGKVTTSNTPNKATQNHKTSHLSFSSPTPTPAQTSPWDYFNLSHTVVNQDSGQERSGANKGVGVGENTRSSNPDDERKTNESITDSEYDGETNIDHEREDSDEFYKDSEDTPSEVFVRSSASTKASDNAVAESLSSIASSATEISETIINERNRSPDLSPLGTIASSVTAHVNLAKIANMDDGTIKESIAKSTESKIRPKDLCSSMIDIDQLFVRASESGQEIPRMLESYKLNFRPKLLKQKGESRISRCVNVFFSCKEPSQVLEEPGQVNTRYLTWQRTMSARFVSSMNTAAQNARDDALAISISNIYCMRSGSHASTLDRLYAWEKKLYDEVKVSQVVRNAYDMKCKLLRDQESRGEPVHRVDKTRVVIKDLHSQIRVAIKRMDSISKKIEEIRDSELQPQLEELVKGLGIMWERMHECHKLQYHIVSVALSNGNKIAINSDSHQQVTNHLEQQLSLLSSSFMKWIAAHKSYLQAIDGWLLKCVIFPEKSTRKKRRYQPVSIRHYGPPIYITCEEWLEGLGKLPTKELADSIKCLTAETSRLLPLPLQEKHHDDNNLVNTFRRVGNSFNAAASNTWRSDFDNFRSSLVQLFSRLSLFSESSSAHTSYTVLQQACYYHLHDLSIRQLKTVLLTLLSSFLTATKEKNFNEFPSCTNHRLFN